MFIKTGISILKKETENAYGDCILTKRYKNSEKIIAVLSDGLGSGIKANILSKMTSTMLLGFAQNNLDPKRACEIVMDSLPVCKVRGISYSTFSLVIIDKNGETYVLEEGNPDFLFFKNGILTELEPKIENSKTHSDRHLKIYKFKIEINDTLVFVSDGVTQAGLGSEHLKEGLKREGLIKIANDFISQNTHFDPSDLAYRITDAARAVSIGGKTGDDTSALVLKAVEPEYALVFTGPPYNSEEDFSWAKIFENFKGKKAVSGGTTAKILSRELKKEYFAGQNPVGNLPSVSFMEGADLVTEGILTLTRAEEYLHSGDFGQKKDAAFELANFLLEADNITFVVGAKVNTAHYDPNLPVEIELRKDVIKRIAKILEDKYLKNVTVRFM